jgi:acetyl-CoA carboxylase biotin carboxyl carrier protein
MGTEAQAQQWSAGMAEKPSGPAEALDVQRIHYLVRLMKRYDLTALDLADGPVHIRLRRSGPISAAPAAMTTAALPAVAAAPVAATAAPVPARPEPAAGPQTIVIESPMVGTYYSSSSPDTPPFVNIGSNIRQDSIVCIIEAMKVFTDIPAGVSGTIAEILVKNGQAVEYGQPMFRVVPA